MLPTNETVQRYVRIALYVLYGALLQIGVTIPDSKKSLIAGIVGVIANLAWTMWGTKLSNMLKEIQKTNGVEGARIIVDPAKIDPVALNQATPAGVIASPVVTGNYSSGGGGQGGSPYSGSAGTGGGGAP